MLGDEASKQGKVASNVQCDEVIQDLIPLCIGKYTPDSWDVVADYATMDKSASASPFLQESRKRG